jgi:hypothetical protein
VERGEGENASCQKLSRTSFASEYIKDDSITLIVLYEFPFVCQENLTLCVGNILITTIQYSVLLNISL